MFSQLLGHTEENSFTLECSPTNLDKTFHYENVFINETSAINKNK